ncbi:hypothetical protein BpHYR1_024710 [Brachionus plicatilis]|uniref:Uncharacterized protein n=1 Tax=Brachionus plicatilis TaxID=10195 RepID=A0A3M7SC39_BRAPC|nr:hypothetical protein BpHYR1_024710 [Brachionus plicatilis]
MRKHHKFDALDYFLIRKFEGVCLGISFINFTSLFLVFWLSIQKFSDDLILYQPKLLLLEMG